MYLFIYIQPQLGSLKLTFLMVKPPSWLLKSYIFHLFHHQKMASSSLAPFISEIAGPPRWFSIGCLSESCELLELPQLDSRNGILPGKFVKKLINKYQVKYSEMVMQANVVGGVNNAWTQWPVNQPKKKMGWAEVDFPGWLILPVKISLSCKVWWFSLMFLDIQPSYNYLCGQFGMSICRNKWCATQCDMLFLCKSWYHFHFI